MDDEYIKTAEVAAEGLIKAMVPGAFLVELFPFLGHLPSWLPGARSKKFAMKYLPHVKRLRDQSYLEVKNAIVGLSGLRAAFQVDRWIGQRNGTEGSSYKPD